MCDPDPPCDAVITWVDGSTERFAANFAAATGSSVIHQNRFRDNGELVHTVRLIEHFLPWIRNIYVVTNGDRPSFALPSKKVVFTDHSEFIPAEYLPTFSSHAIEVALHRIPGLSEFYFYFNDDCFVLKAIQRPQLAQIHPHEYLFTRHGRLTASADASGWLKLLRRTQLLLDDRYGTVDRCTHAHTPQLFRKSACERLEREFATEFALTLSRRLRHPDTVNFRTLYLYCSLYEWAGVSDLANLVQKHPSLIRFVGPRFYRTVPLSRLSHIGGLGDAGPVYLNVQDDLDEFPELDGKMILDAFLTRHTVLEPHPL